MRELPISGQDGYSLFSFDMTSPAAVDEIPDMPNPDSQEIIGDAEFDDIGGAAAAVSVADLSDWRRSDYFLTAHEALSLQFPTGGASVSGQQMVLVHESSRSVTVGEDGKEVQYGVALRQVIRISQLKTKASVALPVLAAQVEMGMVEASVFIEVRGFRYKDAAKYLMGTPTKFDVNGYSETVRRINKLEKLIYKNERGIRPVRLAVAERDGQDWIRSVGHAWGLARLSDGASALRAIAEAPNQDALFLDGIRQVYNDLNTGRSDAEAPTTATSHLARNMLGEIKINRKRRLRIFG